VGAEKWHMGLTMRYMVKKLLRYRLFFFQAAMNKNSCERFSAKKWG